MDAAQDKAFAFLDGPIVSTVTAILGFALFISMCLHFVASFLVNGACVGGSVYMVISAYLACHGLATVAVMLPEGGKLEKISKLVTGTITMYEFHGTKAMYYAFWNILFSACSYGLQYVNILDAIIPDGDNSVCPTTFSFIFMLVDYVIVLGFWCIMFIQIFLWFKKERGTTA